MNDTQLLDLIRAVLTDRLGLDADQVVPAANLREDLAMDSLDAVEMIGALETEIGARLDPADTDGVQTVADVAEAIRRQLLVTT